ncbi:MAG: DUF1722 domain-containing protein [Acidobacteria bacterium]|nr:DUF1722 domain-containing protein [Acidobacteriota bacterium]
MRQDPETGSGAPIRIGISACLLGENVRYDGGHKRDSFLTATFGRYVQWVPVCPEVEMGLGVPRDTLRLEAIEGAVHLIMPKTGEDHTASIRRYAHKRLEELAREELHGYILKKDSPSCGMERVRVYGAGGMPQKTGRGLFAAALLERFPRLPVEEEGRLSDPRLRENFVERVFAYHRLRALFQARWGLKDLIAFHTAHKFQILAHSTKGYQGLGRLVAGAKSAAREKVRGSYEKGFMEALGVLATVRRNTNALHHMAGYLRPHLDDGCREELLSVIEDYRQGLYPLVVPLTLICHHARRFRVGYLLGQTYLEPHPKELMLRNHV